MEGAQQNALQEHSRAKCRVTASAGQRGWRRTPHTQILLSGGEQSSLRLPNRHTDTRAQPGAHWLAEDQDTRGEEGVTTHMLASLVRIHAGRDCLSPLQSGRGLARMAASSAAPAAACAWRASSAATSGRRMAGSPSTAASRRRASLGGSAAACTCRQEALKP